MVTFKLSNTIRQIRAEFPLVKFCEITVKHLKQENVDEVSHSRKIYEEKLS